MGANLNIAVAASIASFRRLAALLARSNSQLLSFSLCGLTVWLYISLERKRAIVGG